MVACRSSLNRTHASGSERTSWVHTTLIIVIALHIAIQNVLKESIERHNFGNNLVEESGGAVFELVHDLRAAQFDFRLVV